MPSLPARIDRYEIVDRLGEGGMGVVYLARDPQLQRTVAIKMLSAQIGSEYQAEVRERFAREARASGALKNNHIVTIYDVGEDEGRPFIAMEFIDGESMAQVIKRSAPLNLARKVQLALELCAGLGHAHKKGIIHRDIKPANLMITGEGTLKILDFGLAHVTAAATAELTQVGAVLGTPYYMSPEQVLGKTVDQRSDIFSVGAVLYEFLTGQRAFAASGQGVLLQILNQEPPPLSGLMPGVDPGLERAVARALHKDPAKRYQNLGELASDLEQVLSRMNDAPASEEATRLLPRVQIPIDLPATILAPRPVAVPEPVAVREPAEAPTLVAAAAPRPVERAPVGVRPVSPPVAPPRASVKPAVPGKRRMAVIAGIVVVVLAIALYASILIRRSAQGSGAAATAPTAVPSQAPVASEVPQGQPTNPADVTPPNSVTPLAPLAAAPEVPATPAPAPAAAAPPPVAPRTRAAAAAPVGSGTAAPAPAAAAASPAENNAPAARPQPSTNSGRSADAARCSQLNADASLGLELTQADKDFLAQQCRTGAP